MASLGFMPRDATYEFIAYRSEGSERPPIDVRDIRLWNDTTKPFTFLNLDGEQVLIEPPHGPPDPVLFGIRGGDSPYHVLAMGNYLASKYGAIGWIIYMTNQGTDEHRSRINEGIPYMNVNFISTVINESFDERGHAHLVLSNSQEIIAYRHLGISRNLSGCIGCLVHAWGGGVKPNDKLNLYIEGMRTLHDRYVKVKNPRCPRMWRPHGVHRQGWLIKMQTMWL
ncbi:DUF1743 domain-containing protein [Vulcanisaeta souniana]|uniref:TiaS agmantine-binding domain-containing protein n=1 Tax=Vulcanisaeta souniana TaxID=164452 RepID=UPI0006D0ED5D|nr:DUF1743 domain-containing protein [Vulcanisaeta souniana]